jgi:hypothetical protein
VPGNRSTAEARLEPLEERLSQSDFGKEDERLLAAAQALGDRFEIDFRLARSGDAIEQHGIEAVADRGREASRGLALVVVEIGRRVARIRHCQGPVCIDRHWFESAGVDETAKHPHADAGVVSELADRALSSFERREGLFALGREPFRNQAGRTIFGELARPVEGSR